MLIIETVTTLENRDTEQFQATAQRFGAALEEALSQQPSGQFQVNVIRFQPAAGFGSLVSLDMSVVGRVTESDVKNIWTNLLSRQIPLRGYNLVGVNFDMKLLEGRPQCPEFVGREPTDLPRAGDNWANLLLNNAFPCSGTVTAWQYYRLSSQGTAYVGVWRLTPSSQFLLVDKTELPPAQTGPVEVTLAQPIKVNSGDFIGIFYSSSTPNNVIAQATLDDDAVPSEQLYQNYRVQ
ncbi:basement membrane-specific heparan sulfate proteoglycan core protein, partial [Plakobranchus ocellatus]